MNNLELLEQTYINLADCYDVIKFDELTPEEQRAADKLANFCLRVIPTLKKI
jgi:hypothetical protein